MNGTIVFSHAAEDSQGKQTILTIEGLKNGLRIDVATNLEVATIFLAYDEAIDQFDFCVALGCQSRAGYQRAKTIGLKRLIALALKLSAVDESEINDKRRDDRQIVLPAILSEGEPLR